MSADTVSPTSFRAFVLSSSLHAAIVALALLVRRRLAAYVPGGLRAALRSVVDGGVRVVGTLLREGTPLGVQMGMEAWAFSAAGLMRVCRR